MKYENFYSANIDCFCHLKLIAGRKAASTGLLSFAFLFIIAFNPFLNPKKLISIYREKMEATKITLVPRKMKCSSRIQTRFIQLPKPVFFPWYHPVFLKYLILILQQTGDTTPYRPLYPPPPSSPTISESRWKQMKGNKILVWKVYRLHCPIQHLLWCWYCDVNVKICFEYLDFSLLWPSAVWIWQYFLSWQKKLVFCSMWIHTKVFKPNSYFRLIWNSVWLQSTGVSDFWQQLPIGIWWALCVTCLGEFCQVE